MIAAIILAAILVLLAAAAFVHRRGTDATRCVECDRRLSGDEYGVCHRCWWDRQL